MPLSFPLRSVLVAPSPVQSERVRDDSTLIGKCALSVGSKEIHCIPSVDQHDDDEVRNPKSWQRHPQHCVHQGCA